VSDQGPYLDRGLGGIGGGAAAELNLLTDAPISAAVEISTGVVCSLGGQGRVGAKPDLAHSAAAAKIV